MDKTVYSGMAVISVVLIAGSGWFPDNAAMWLASTSPLMNVARAIIALLMLGLVVTDPPRRREFRTVLGVAATGFLIAALSRAFSGSVLLIDALLFMGAAISFALAAAEGVPLPQRQPVLAPKRYVQYDHLFKSSPLGYALSDASGMLVPTYRRRTELLAKAMLTTSVITGALQQNIRPYRSLWRGG